MLGSLGTKQQVHIGTPSLTPSYQPHAFQGLQHNQPLREISRRSKGKNTDLNAVIKMTIQAANPLYHELTRQVP